MIDIPMQNEDALRATIAEAVREEIKRFPFTAMGRGDFGASIGFGATEHDIASAVIARVRTMDQLLQARLLEGSVLTVGNECERGMVGGQFDRDSRVIGPWKKAAAVGGDR